MNYTKLTRKLRQRIFDYPDNLQEKADRILKKAIVGKILQNKKTEAKGIYSELTKQELAKTGTCETDWY